MRYLCCCRGSSELDNDAPRLIPKDAIRVVPNVAPPVIPSDELQVISNDAPILRICFAAKTLGIKGTRWKCREYQIKFRDLFTWRCAFDHLDMSLVPDPDASCQGNGSSSENNTKLDMTTAEYGEEETVEVERDGKTGDNGAVKSESRWSLSTTHSTLSLDAVRASGNSHSRKKTSTKTSLPSDSVQTMRLKSKQTDSSKHSRRYFTHGQSQKEHASYSSAEDAEEEKRRFNKEALEQLEAKHSQPQLGTLKHQEWSRLCMLIANGLDKKARGYFPEVAEGQEALLLPIEQNRNSFEVDMKTTRRIWYGEPVLEVSGEDIMVDREASDIEDARAALEQIESWKWKDVVIFVRDGDTPLEQTEWRIMERLRVLNWAPPFI